MQCFHNLEQENNRNDLSAILPINFLQTPLSARLADQMFAMPMDKLVDEDLICALTGSYITGIKQRAANCISKHGIEVFGGKR